MASSFDQPSASTSTATVNAVVTKTTVTPEIRSASTSFSNREATAPTSPTRTPIGSRIKPSSQSPNKHNMPTADMPRATM